MPTVQPGSKVLVSGANGFIAVWVVKTLLEKGYLVRGTIRSPQKGEHLKSLFKSYGDKLELVVVEDIMKEGAFDEAVKDVDAIEHTASPFHMNADDPNDVIHPAVKGTVGIIKSAIKNGSKVKRIVVTSSCASVLRNEDKPLVFSELDWNNQAIENVEKHGKKADASTKYCASKTLAEKAAWDLWKENQKSVQWDLVCMNPPYVFGPPLHEVSSPDALNTSSLSWYQSICTPDNGGKSAKELHTQGPPWIDVRDLASAHVLSLEKEKAGGERIIIAAGSTVWQEWIDAANKISPNPLPSHKLSQGVPDANLKPVYQMAYDTSKAEKILGIKYISMEQNIKDTLANYAEKGW